MYVSWADAVAFCKTLSDMEGRTYRLPTEAEWESACRGGTRTAFSFGDDEADLEKYAWFSANAYKTKEKYAHRVAQKLPNPFGLYDMHGNVWEWCRDWYDAKYYAAAPDQDPPGPSSGSFRVLRDAYWFREPISVRCASRFFNAPVERLGSFGFRLGLE